MGQHYIRQKAKSFGSFLIILILLPYIMAVFINGGNIKAIGKDKGAYVRVRLPSGEKKEQITDISWEEYFIGVLAKEMSPDYKEEALKAQAVLIRTNLYQALDVSEDNILANSYLNMEELAKKWGSKEFDKNYKKLKNAMSDTENQVLFYNEAYAMVPFHQSSNGKTRSAKEVLGSDEYPYLVMRECPQDKEAEDEMYVYNMEYKEIQSKCQSFLVAVDKENAKKTFNFADFEIQEYDEAGYVSKMRIGDTICTGEQFREALSLASSAFTLQDASENLRITTMGKGHGLGMSQWTANEMAKAGKTYEEILQNFFDGTNLTDGGKIFTKVE